MTNKELDTDTYALKSEAVTEFAAPELNYRPPMPRAYSPRIGLIGAGGISASHLDAYRTAGWEVASICNRTRSKAESRAAEFYPDAFITDNFKEILDDASIDVVDITPHPADRIPLIEAALKSGKHVLSQKPFVLDLEDGERLIRIADDNGVKLAINQNGRWAPHLSWMREAVRSGLIGDLLSVHISIHWDHSWVKGTPFEEIEDLILYDFGIHWFDFVTSIAGDRLQSVFSTTAHSNDRNIAVPLLAQAIVRFDGGQASLVFDGDTRFGSRDTIFIAGTKGSLQSNGPDLGDQVVTLHTKQGVGTPELEGTWFNDGFRGAMGALLVAIEENCEPENGARENLKSLALAFSAIKSSHSNHEVTVGETKRIIL